MWNLTKEQAIAEHRKMWRWIAETTKNEKRTVEKEEYLTDVLKLEHSEFPDHDCFLCEYTKEALDTCLTRCIFCPLKWGAFNCVLGLYSQWLCAKRGSDWEQAAKFAENIAELPEKED